METSSPRRGLPLHSQIFVALLLGAVAGGVCQAVFGADNPTLQNIVKNVAQPVGQVFLRLIFMVVVPLLFSALVLGVADMGDARKVGRLGVKALGMTVLLSGLAVALALFAVQTFKPGVGVDPERRDNLMRLYASQDQAKKNIENAQKAKTAVEAVLEIIPRNPLEEAVRALEGGLLPLMFFALVVGVALSTVPEDKAAPLKVLLDAIFAVSLRIIEFAMKFAPIGVFGLIFSTAALLGVDALVALGKYVLVVLGALAFHQFLTYSLAIRFIARRDPIQFFSQIKEVMLTAFATSSSNATLPTALRVAEEEVGLPRDISTFVLTVGATANQNGTALFEGITILFLAQFFGVELSIGQQLLVLGTAIVAGVGTAGVPGGAWPMIAIILVKIGVPAEAIGLVLGIDRILDMSRTVLNVSGDITIAACVTALEGERPATPEPASPEAIGEVAAEVEAAEPDSEDGAAGEVGKTIGPEERR